MARRVEISVLCDVCLAEDVESEGVEVSVSLDGAAPRTLALCETDRKDLLDPLADALVRLGQLPEGASIRDRKSELCPVCGKGYTTRKRLGDHMGKMHGTTLGLLESGQEPDSEAFPCDRCDKSFPTSQGLSMHKTRKGHR